MKSILRTIKKYLLYIYDYFTAKYVEVSVGDIVNLRCEIEPNQFLIASRVLDIEDFIENKNLDFIWQNTISRRAYGELHREEEGNLKFKSLIDSYRKNGYDYESYITTDKELRIMDGNHRMGMNIYYSIDKIKVKMLRRKCKIPQNISWYVEVGLPYSFINTVISKYELIEKKMIHEGQTFICIFQCNENNEDVINTLLLLTNVKRVSYCRVIETGSVFSQNAVMVQFLLSSPNYRYKNGRAISSSAIEIEKILKNRFHNLEFFVSKNCLEGAKIFNSIQIISDLSIEEKGLKNDN